MSSVSSGIFGVESETLVTSSRFNKLSQSACLTSACLFELDSVKWNCLPMGFTSAVHKGSNPSSNSENVRLDRLLASALSQTEIGRTGPFGPSNVQTGRLAFE